MKSEEAWRGEKGGKRDSERSRRRDRKEKDADGNPGCGRARGRGDEAGDLKRAWGGARQRLGGGERKTEIQKGVEKGRGGEQEREAGRGRREAEQQLTEKEENFLPT